MLNKIRLSIITTVILLIITMLSSSIFTGLTFNTKRHDDVLYCKIKLSYNEEGKFKVLILADIHARGAIPEELQDNIKNLVDKEQPSLVIFTGDNTICSSISALRKALNSMTKYLEEKQIPWCHVYGNHDHEGGLSKETMQQVYETYDYCVSKRGPYNLHGVGNYVLPIYKYNSDEIGSLIWCLDSGNYLSEKEKETLDDLKSLYPEFPNAKYDYIKENQIEWYKNTSIELEKKYNKKISSLMAFHIPLQETATAWNMRDELNHTGTKGEAVQGSVINSHLFDAILKREDVKAIVNGHDHINDFMVEYLGIKLCYSPTISTLTYHDNNLRGGRVFIMDENDADSIDTYMSYLFN